MNSQERKFEIIYNNSSKIARSFIETYEDLVEEIHSIFKINNNDSIEIYYLKEGELISVENTETLRNLRIYDQTHSSNSNFVLRISVVSKPREVSLNLGEKANHSSNNGSAILHKKKELFELILFADDNKKEEEYFVSDYKNQIKEEIKSLILGLFESDIEAELYLQDIENINTLKKLIDEIVRSRTEAYKKQIEISRPKNFLEQEISLKTEKKAKSRVEFQEKCELCLSFPIIESKFICLFCDDMVLCKNCELEHGHPAIKINNHSIPDKIALFNVIDLNESKKGFISNAKDYLFGSKAPKLRISTQNKSKKFNVKPNTEIKLVILLENLSSYIIPKNGTVIPLNNKDLGFRNFTVKSAIERHILPCEFTCMAPNRIGEYSINFVFYHYGCEVECEPLNIVIKVCIDQESFIEEFFDSDQFIKDSNLNPKQKEKIFYVIKNDLSIRNSIEIASILNKHNWNISASIDELSCHVKDENEIFKDKIEDFDMIVGFNSSR